MRKIIFLIACIYFLTPSCFGAESNSAKLSKPLVVLWKQYLSFNENGNILSGKIKDIHGFENFRTMSPEKQIELVKNYQPEQFRERLIIAEVQSNQDSNNKKISFDFAKVIIAEGNHQLSEIELILSKLSNARKLGNTDEVELLRNQIHKTYGSEALSELDTL